MWNKTLTTRILDELAKSRRRVVSDWRIHVLARRISYAENAPLPDLKKIKTVRNEMLRRGELISIRDVSGIYIVNIPYANLLEVSEEQILQEADPWAIFGFLTAMSHHGLTDLIPKEIYAISAVSNRNDDRIPFGTAREDWADGIDQPIAKHPKLVRGIKVNWSRLTNDPGIGVTVGYSFGVPIYLTDIERTLIDAIDRPDKSGGIAKSLQAWKNLGAVDLDKLIKYVNIYNNKVLRQKIGFLLETLGYTHPGLEEWRRRLIRGSSVKLVSSEPYSSVHSKEWNLSLNIPSSVLSIINEE